MHPDQECVQNAIAVSVGRKLDVVRMFTNERDLPDVTSLIISKSQGECGVGFTEHFDPEKTRKEVYLRDWSEISTDFDLYIETVEKNVVPKKRRKRPEALELMSEFYKNNRSVYPSSVKDMREEIIILLMEGFTEKEAFDQAMVCEH